MTSLDADIQFLLDHPGTGVAEPANEASIDSVEEELDCVLPEALKQLWLRSDGLTFADFEGELLGPSGVLDLVEERARLYIDWGHLPFFQFESSYAALLIRDGLSPRIGASDLGRLAVPKFRSVESFLSALATALRAGERADVLLFDSPGDYAPHLPRTESDREVARALLRQEKPKEGDWERALVLLDENCEPEFRTLLGADDGQLRRDTIAFMKETRSRSLQELLQEDQREFDAFMTRFMAIISEVAQSPAERRKGSVRVQGKSLSGDHFFSLYRRADFEEKVREHIIRLLK